MSAIRCAEDQALAPSRRSQVRWARSRAHFPFAVAWLIGSTCRTIA